LTLRKIALMNRSKNMHYLSSSLTAM